MEQTNDSSTETPTSANSAEAQDVRDYGAVPEQKLEQIPSSSHSSEVEEDDQDAEPATLSKTKSLQHRVSLPREILVVSCICLAMFMTQAGLGIGTTLIHVIGDHFGVTNPGILSWLVAGYSLTVGTFILFTGRLGDLYGWKRMFVIGFAWFSLWSLICGVAFYSNHVLFVFARVLQGVGPAILLPNGLALLGGLYESGPRKNMAFAIFGAMAPVGSVIGSIFAGIFWLAWWPWAFFCFSIVTATIAVTSAFIIPDPQEEKPGFEKRGFRETIDELDLYGAATGILALVLFNFAWNQAPIVTWAEPYIIVCLILGVLLVPVFFYLEIKVSPSPILPVDIFNSSNAFVLACVTCGWATFGIWYYYLWQLIEVLRRENPLLSAAYFTPVIISGAVAAIATGKLLGILRPAWVMVLAMCAFLMGISILSTVPPDQIYWGQIFVCLIVTPFGMDMSFPSATVIISDSVKKKHQGVAASLVNTVVNYRISLGLGFAGTIEKHYDKGGKTDQDILRGYRSAEYFGIGLSAFGMMVAIVFLTKSLWDDRKQQRKTDSTDEPEAKA